jgi:hypothetical protein
MAKKKRESGVKFKTFRLNFLLKHEQSKISAYHLLVSTKLNFKKHVPFISICVLARKLIHSQVQVIRREKKKSYKSKSKYTNASSFQGVY